MSNSYSSEEYKDAVVARHLAKHKILHPTNDHRKWAQEYADYFMRTGTIAKKYSKSGYAEYYRLVIIGRLQNRTLQDIATEHDVTPERIRQIFAKFSRWATKRGYDLKRPLMQIVGGDLE